MARCGIAVYRAARVAGTYRATEVPRGALIRARGSTGTSSLPALRYAGMAGGRDGALRHRSRDGRRPRWGVAAAQPVWRARMTVGRATEVLGGATPRAGGSRPRCKAKQQPEQEAAGTRKEQKRIITKLACGARKDQINTLGGLYVRQKRNRNHIIVSRYMTRYVMWVGFRNQILWC
jgi:hypothetical protein